MTRPVAETVHGRIGPNAIIQTAAALRERVGVARADALVAAATGRALGAWPEAMVDESEVIRLVHAVHEDLDPALREAVMRDAGVRTAEYLLANRIPRAAQRVLRLLPGALALRLLLFAISRHTWTFAGTAQVEIRYGATVSLSMRGCPMCRGVRATAPDCHYVASTLGHLAQRLADAAYEVVETACEAQGGTACRFEFRREWGSPVTPATVGLLLTHPYAMG